MSSLAAHTRAAVRARPFLYDALRAGILNYTAAARTLDIDGETEAVATALRRYAEELPAADRPGSSARVNMRSGLGRVDDGEALLTVGEASYAADAGSSTGIAATGEIDATAVERVLGRLRTEGVDVSAAGFAGDSLVLVVGRRDGPDAVRAVESAFGK